MTVTTCGCSFTYTYTLCMHSAFLCTWSVAQHAYMSVAGKSENQLCRLNWKRKATHGGNIIHMFACHWELNVSVSENSAVAAAAAVYPLTDVCDLKQARWQRDSDDQRGWEALHHKGGNIDAGDGLAAGRYSVLGPAAMLLLWCMFYAWN